MPKENVFVHHSPIAKFNEQNNKLCDELIKLLNLDPKENYHEITITWKLEQLPIVATKILKPYKGMFNSEIYNTPNIPAPPETPPEEVIPKEE